MSNYGHFAYSIGYTQISTSLPEHSSGTQIPYYLDKYYYFRCEVNNSLRQVWKISGSEVFRLGPSFTAPSFREEESLSLFVEDVVDHGNSLRYYVSYLWFNSSKFEEASNVTCASETEDATILFQHQGSQRMCCSGYNYYINAYVFYRWKPDSRNYSRFDRDLLKKIT